MPEAERREALDEDGRDGLVVPVLRDCAGRSIRALAAATLVTLGGQLQGNGEQMVSYAERFQRSLGEFP